MDNRKVAVITGSGKRRIGNAIAFELAKRGYDIAVHYHKSATEAGATVTELKSLGIDAIAVQADISQELDVARLVQETFDHFGRIDVLVNAAAIWISAPLEATTAELLRRHFDINTIGSFLCAQQVGLQMVKQPEGGSIIMFGDWAVQRPYRNYAAYFPSKGSIPAMTRSLAVELGLRNSRIRVNCIEPGPVLLPEDMPAEERDQSIRGTLLKREGGASSIAQAVVFLIENDFVTGVCLPVDGGRTIYAVDA